MLVCMDATVLTPAPGQTVITTEDGYHSHKHYTDPWVLQGQADIRDDIGEAKYDLAETINSRAAENLQAAARNDVITQANFTAASDRLAQASRDINAQIVHGVDVLQQAEAKSQHLLSDVRFELQAAARDLGDRLSMAHCKMLERAGEIELRLTKSIDDARVERVKEHCEIKELVRAEAAATREQAANFRMQDQAALIAELKMNAALAKKP
jgi:hypothetical protein